MRHGIAMSGEVDSVSPLPPFATHRPHATHSPTPSPCDSGHTMFHMEHLGGLDMGGGNCGRLMLWSGTARHGHRR